MNTRDVLTPEALEMLELAARLGSFAAAARELGVVPSALTYRVRQIEDALDVLLFDRSSRRAVPTPAGLELLREGRRVLGALETLASRVKRVATGWEAQLTIAADGVVSQRVLLELCEAFYAHAAQHDAPTALKLRSETLSGTWEALNNGSADLAIGGVAVYGGQQSDGSVQSFSLGEVAFVYAVAPHHPLARAAEPISEAELVKHRAVAVADSAQRLTPVTVGLGDGQPVLTVATLQQKLDAQLRGLGCGFLPEPMARPYLQTGRLIQKQVERAGRSPHLCVGWRTASGTQGARALGLALQWWLGQLRSPTTQKALLEAHGAEVM
jgi:DNA-binding transcriptional LysR family regulator